MEMLKCEKCKNYFDEEEIEYTNESSYFVGGDYCHETFAVCPYCGNYHFEKAYKCKICDEMHTEEELHGGVCDECINEKKNDFDACYNISIGQNTEVKVNELIATILDEPDINEILRKYIKENMPEVDCSAFIGSDIDWFGEQLAEGRDKM